MQRSRVADSRYVPVRSLRQRAGHARFADLNAAATSVAGGLPDPDDTYVGQGRRACLLVAPAAVDVVLKKDSSAIPVKLSRSAIQRW